MTSKAFITKRVNLVKKYLEIIRRLAKFSKDDIQNDDMIRGSVEWYVYIICQICIDLANIVIGYKDERKPISMNESFLILAEEKIINSNLVDTMMKLVEIRNMLAFDYDKINYDIIVDVLNNKVKDIDKFVLVIEKKILK